MKIYISGPMTGYPDYNYPAFFKAEENLKKEYSYILNYPNIKILNPARIDDDESEKFTKKRSYYMLKSIEMLLDATHIFVLPEWNRSKGAKLEIALANEFNLGFLGTPISYYEIESIIGEIDSTHDESNIFDIAKKLVSNDRQKQYGPPEQHLTDVGRIWGALLQIEDISPQKVALMMTGLKLARETFCPKKDNRVDAIGYLYITDLLEEIKNEKFSFDKEEKVC